MPRHGKSLNLNTQSNTFIYYINVNTLSFLLSEVKLGYPKDQRLFATRRTEAREHDLSNYFRAQCHLGLLLRQEPSTSIIPAFLQANPGDRVLDLCGGGEHRAPMIVETLSATESGTEQTGMLVVNERDTSAASNAHRSLMRTLALSREVVTARKALEFPQPHDYDGGDTEKALFDRVICSAPYSCRQKLSTRI